MMINRQVSHLAIVKTQPLNGQCVSQWFEQAERPQIILDPSRCVLAANASARQELARSDFFRTNDGVLHGVTSQIEAALETLETCPRCLLTAWRGDKSNDLIIVKIEQSDELTNISFKRLDSDGTVPCIQIGSAHDLTRAEERVLNLILENQSADEIAETLGISVETARTHRKRIYAKFGVNGRPDLLAYVARLFL